MQKKNQVSYIIIIILISHCPTSSATAPNPATSHIRRRRRKPNQKKIPQKRRKSYQNKIFQQNPREKKKTKQIPLPSHAGIDGQAVTHGIRCGSGHDPGLYPAVVGQISGHQHHLYLSWMDSGWRGGHHLSLLWADSGWRGGVVYVWLEGWEVETDRPDGWRSAFVVGGQNWRRCLVVAGCDGGVGGGRGIWEREGAGVSVCQYVGERGERIKCFHFRWILCYWLMCQVLIYCCKRCLLQMVRFNVFW